MRLKLLLLSLFLISCNNNNSVESPDCAGVSGGNAVEDCAGECGGSAVLDECGVCNGEGIADGACDCADNVEDACGKCGGDGSTCEAVDGMWIIYYNTSTPIGGFQFEVEGVTVDGVSGGAAEDAGFMVSTGNNTVIGFSFSGSTVPVGDGILIVLDVTGSGDACIVEESLIIADAAGLALPADIENCNTIQIP